MWLLFFTVQGILGRMAGNGFGAKWNIAWLPEIVHSIPYGVALGWMVGHLFGAGALWIMFWFVIGATISYAGMQSATWAFLKWTHDNAPNTKRGFTLKPLVDWLAKLLGYKLGDEGYSWIAAGIKGFIIGLPVGGVFTAILWALGYEIGSHARGRVERFGIDPHLISEVASAFLGAVSIFVFVTIINLIV